MNQSQFQNQISRLIATFGKAAYSSERVALLWREVESLSEPWLIKTVDKFIGECRQAPLMPEFRHEISIERERVWAREKEEHKQDALELAHVLENQDMVRNICGKILKRMNNEVEDQEWSNFQKNLRSMGGA